VKSDLCIICMSKIFQVAYCGQYFQRVLRHNLVSHWCIHPYYCPWYQQSLFYLLSCASIEDYWKDSCLQQRNFCVSWNFHFLNDSCQIFYCYFAQAYSLPDLFISLAVTLVMRTTKNL
jgi:hypothetical protein